MEPREGGSPIRVLLVDDNKNFRKTTRRILLTTEDIEVVGEADDGERSLAEVKRLAPDVVLMDCCMPGMDGAEATRKILVNHPSTRVVGLTTGDDSRLLSQMESAGAHPVVLKGAGPEELGRAIRSAIH